MWVWVWEKTCWGVEKTRSDGQGGEGRVSVDKGKDKMGEQNHPNLAIDQLGRGGKTD